MKDEKVKIGSCQLGVRTNKKFLTGLIPDGWGESVYEHDRFWSCKCKRDDSVTTKNWCEKEKEWVGVCDKIVNEFNNSLMEIYSITDIGVHFIVYLRKS